MECKCIFRLFIICATFFMSGIWAYSQPPLSEYYPVGTTWEEVTTIPDYELYPNDSYSGDFFRYLYTIDGDTIVGEKTFKIVTRKLIEMFPPKNFDDTWVFYLREQNDSVFISSSLKSDGLIFNWGEKFITYYGMKYNIENMSLPQELLLDGNYYDYYSMKDRGGEKRIYKTIGQTIGGLVIEDPSRTPIISRLTKFTRNNVLIYEHVMLSPQSSSVFELTHKERDGLRDCYSLQGIKMDGENLKPGIYIQNGKKYIVR